MEVHKQISSHSEKQHKIVKDFLYWDEEREQCIEEAIKLVRLGQPFTVEHINRAAEKINEIAAANGITPTRSIITEKMVIEYIQQK